MKLAAEKGPNDPLILLNLADALAAEGQKEKAGELYSKVTELKGVDPGIKAKAEGALEKLK